MSYRRETLRPLDGNRGDMPLHGTPQPDAMAAGAPPTKAVRVPVIPEPSPAKQVRPGQRVAAISGAGRHSALPRPAVPSTPARSMAGASAGAGEQATPRRLPSSLQQSYP